MRDGYRKPTLKRYRSALVQQPYQKKCRNIPDQDNTSKCRSIPGQDNTLTVTGLTSTIPKGEKIGGVVAGIKTQTSRV